jgi:hypothetical protein
MGRYHHLIANYGKCMKAEQTPYSEDTTMYDTCGIEELKKGKTITVQVVFLVAFYSFFV